MVKVKSLSRTSKKPFAFVPGKKRQSQLKANPKDHHNNQYQNYNPTKKFAGVLAKILSAAQNETEMAVIFERHQFINTQKKPL